MKTKTTLKLTEMDYPASKFKLALKAVYPNIMF